MSDGLRLLRAHVLDQLRRRHAGSSLGPLWHILPSVAQIVLYAAIFSGIMTGRSGGLIQAPGQFVVYLCLGLFPWTALADSLGRATHSINEGASLLRRTPMPLWMFPVASTIASFLQCAAAIGLLLATAPLLGVAPGWGWCLVPLPIVLMALTAAGLALALAPLAVLFRDLPHVVPMVLPFLLWSAPIIYVRDILPGWMQPIAALHPLFPPIDLLHRLVLGLEPVDPWLWIRAIAIAGMAMATGWLVLRGLDHEVRDAI